MQNTNDQNQFLNDELDLELEEESQENKNQNEATDEVISISKNKLKLIMDLLQTAKSCNEKISDLLSTFRDNAGTVTVADLKQHVQELSETSKQAEETDDNIIEGVFDGEKMIGPDGKEYSIPANYASKSKLVEGDIMKLTIAHNGAFIYKQIGPIERKRIIGILEKSANGIYYVREDDRKWRVLTASVTYYKGEPGDETAIFVPKYSDSQWAAVDNIVKKM